MYLFFFNLRYKVRDGSKIHFWENLWIEGESFLTIFSRIYSCVEKNIPINRMHSLCQNFRFRRNLNVWEVEEFSSLMLVLEGVTIRTNSNDRMLWTNDSSRYFFCKSYFEFLVDNHNEQVFDILHQCGQVLFQSKLSFWNGWLLLRRWIQMIGSI